MEAPTTPPNAAAADTWLEMLRVVMRCGRAAQRALAAQVEDRLGLSQLSMLWACRDLASTEPSQLDLARHLGLSPAQVSGTVETLRRDGLLESQRSPQDRRRQTWRLTTEGMQALGDVDERLSAWSANCLDAIGIDNTRNLPPSIVALQQVIETQPEDADQPTLAADTTRQRRAA